MFCKIFIYVHKNLCAPQTWNLLEKLALFFLYNFHREHGLIKLIRKKLSPKINVKNIKNRVYLLSESCYKVIKNQFYNRIEWKQLFHGNIHIVPFKNFRIIFFFFLRGGGGGTNWLCYIQINVIARVVIKGLTYIYVGLNHFWGLHTNSDNSDETADL